MLFWKDFGRKRQGSDIAPPVRRDVTSMPRLARTFFPASSLNTRPPRHIVWKALLGSEKVVLAGWSGGGLLLVIENSADDAVPQPHSKMLHDAALSTDNTFHVVKGATHYYAGQRALLAEATSLIFDWLSARRMGVH